MLSDVMEHFGLRKSLHQVDVFETDHHRQLLKDLKAAIHEGGIVAWKRNKKVASKPRPCIRTAGHALLCPSR
jgi:hypothetical protein